MKKACFLFLLLISSLFVNAAQWAASGEVLTFPANPSKGFNWGYAIYVPADLDTSKKLPLLFTMNNSGNAKDIAEMEEKTIDHITDNSVVYKIPDALKVPMIMPLVLRSGTDNLYSHQFNRVTFLTQDKKYKRLDLQVLAMIKDARKELKKRGIHTYEKVLVAGYSAAGAFGERFTFLHPDKVLAAAIGGNVYPTFPLDEQNGVPLLFPVGAYDVKQVTGKPFNKKKWLQVPILHTNGAVDYNDPLPWDDVMRPEDQELMLKVYGYGTTTMERWKYARKVLAETAPNIQTHTYPNEAHTPVLQDMIAFLETHKKGGPLKPIKLTDTSDQKSPLPIYISALYWGQEAPITVAREHLSDTDLILKSSGEPPFWVKSDYRLDITYNGEPIITDKKMGNLFNDHGQIFLQESFSPEEVKLLKSKKNARFGVKARLVPELADSRWKVPELIVIPQELTFSVK